MSLFGSLFTGVSALGAQSQSMAMISNNIANVNTVGYKRDETNFSSLVTNTSRSAAFSPGGVRASTKATVNQQGILQQTNSTTDIAVSGDGFFVVRQSPQAGNQETFYTRAGSFQEDSLGFLRNASGNYLMGWRLDAQGELPPANADVASVEAVDVAFLNGLTAPTTEAEVHINLDATQNAAIVAPHFTRAITVYDTLGSAQSLQLDFTKTGTNAWSMTLTDPGGGTINGAASLGPLALSFNGDGSINSTATAAANPEIAIDVDGNLQLTASTIDWGNGSNPQNITIDVGNFTQFSADYGVAFVEQNGAELGLRTGVNIDEDGFVIASFSNGQTQKIYKVPLATFANPNGLEQLSGNIYRQTTDSGDYNLREPGLGGSGNISPSSLEASNVDLADEFSRMIITQRAYSAGTKVINTSDQMLNELLQLR